jgi:hypothetical protein
VRLFTEKKRRKKREKEQDKEEIAGCQDKPHISKKEDTKFIHATRKLSSSNFMFSHQGNSLYQRQTRKEKQKTKGRSRFIWETRKMSGSTFMFSHQGNSLYQKETRREKK